MGALFGLHAVPVIHDHNTGHSIRFVPLKYGLHVMCVGIQTIPDQLQHSLDGLALICQLLHVVGRGLKLERAHPSRMSSVASDRNPAIGA